MMRLLVISLIFISTVKSELSNGKVYIQKCCENNQFVVGRKICTDHSKYLGFNDVTDFSKVTVYGNNLTRIGYFPDFFEFTPGYFKDETARNDTYLHLKYFMPAVKILQNGSVMLLAKNDEKAYLTITPKDYCIDNFIKGINITRSSLAVFYRNSDNRQMNPAYFKYGFLISSIFLFLLLVVYLLLPELLNLGGMILVAYTSSLMLAFLFLFIMMVRRGTFAIPVCKALTCLIYFFLMSSFCWMNVMSYDIWWTFRGYAKARAIHRRGVAFKFGMYSLFAWGIPFIMTAVLAIMNEIKRERLPGIIKPEIPDRGCFIEGQAKFAYMYVPMLIMIMLNWSFFGLTVFNIWRLSRGTSILADGGNGAAAAGNPSAHRTQKHRFIVYLKLSVVMGLNWLLEVISSFNPNFGGWYISDTYNIFIGFIIFVIFVCKKKILKKLVKRWRHISSEDEKSKPPLPESLCFNQPYSLCHTKGELVTFIPPPVFKNFAGSEISKTTTFHRPRLPAQRPDLEAQEAQKILNHKLSP